MKFAIYLMRPNHDLQPIEYDIDPVDVCSEIAEGFMDGCSDDPGDENYFDPKGCEIVALAEGGREVIARCPIKRKKPRGQKRTSVQRRGEGRDVAGRWAFPWRR